MFHHYLRGGLRNFLDTVLHKNSFVFVFHLLRPGVSGKNRFPSFRGGCKPMTLTSPPPAFSLQSCFKKLFEYLRTNFLPALLPSSPSLFLPPSLPLFFSPFLSFSSFPFSNLEMMFKSKLHNSSLFLTDAPFHVIHCIKLFGVHVKESLKVCIEKVYKIRKNYRWIGCHEA